MCNIVTKMKHLERKIREKQQIRERILKAALQIAEDEGWTAVTIRRIADAIEYTTSIVYSHFDSKEALLDELATGGFESLSRQLQKILSKELDPAQQLRKLSEINWDFAVQHMALYNLMFNMGKPKNPGADKGMELVQQVFKSLTGKEDVQEYVLNWICLRRGCIHTMLNFNYKEKGQASPRSSKKRYMSFIDRFIQSIL